MDQIYLRHARELPHFRDPGAVVGIFMTDRCERRTGSQSS
jgi:hypothetical protein